MKQKRTYTKKQTDAQIQMSDQMDAILDMLATKGVIPDSTISQAEVQAKIQAKRQRMYHNTILLLRNYRDIQWILECFPNEVASELEIPFASVDMILDVMDMELSRGNSKMESRLKSMQKSRLMLDRINEALTVLRKKPGNGEALYQVIYYTYLHSETLSNDQILKKLNRSARHYYRLRSDAITILSIRLWSTPNGTLDTWLDILTLLEKEE